MNLDIRVCTRYAEIGKSETEAQIQTLVDRFILLSRMPSGAWRFHP